MIQQYSFENSRQSGEDLIPSASHCAQNQLNTVISAQSLLIRQQVDSTNSKYGLRVKKTTPDEAQIVDPKKRIRSYPNHSIAAQNCVKRREAKMNSKRVTIQNCSQDLMNVNAQHQSPTMNQSKKYSSQIQTKEVGKLEDSGDQIDRFNSTKISLDIECSNPYLIEIMHSEISSPSTQKQDSSQDDVQTTSNGRNAQYLGKRAFPSLYSFIQRRQHQLDIKDKNQRDQNDIASGHEDSSSKQTSNHHIHFKNKASICNQKSESVAMAPTKLKSSSMPIIAFQKMISLNQKVWPAKSTCNHELKKCNSILKNWITTDLDSSSNRVPAFEDQTVQDKTVDENIQKGDSIQSLLQHFDQDHQHLNLDQKLGLNSNNLVDINNDIVLLHDEYKRQEEAMTHFLKTKIQQNESSPQTFSDSLNKFLENQTKLRLILNILIKEQNKSLDKQQENINSTPNQLSPQLPLKSMQSQIVSAQANTNEEHCQKDQEAEVSFQTQVTSATGSPHSFTENHDTKCADQKQFNNIQSVGVTTDINNQAEALMDLINQMMMEGVQTQSADIITPVQNQSDSEVSNDNIISQMKEAITSLKNKVY